MKQSGTKYYSQTNFMPAQLRFPANGRLGFVQADLQRAGRKPDLLRQRRERFGERFRSGHHRGDSPVIDQPLMQGKNI